MGYKKTMVGILKMRREIRECCVLLSPEMLLLMWLCLVPEIIVATGDQVRETDQLEENIAGEGDQVRAEDLGEIEEQEGTIGKIIK